MKSPTISIIIPTWNTADITLKNINTIIKYLPKNFAEIIVVDNNSADDTFLKINEFKNSLEIGNWKLEIIHNKTNLGFSRANNIGAKQAKGEFILFLNSDMELIDSSLVTMVNYLKSHPQIGIIGPKFLNPDFSIQGSVFPPQTALNAFKQYWLGINSYSKYAPVGELPLPVWSVSGGAILIPKKLFNKVNGWDERYFFYYEDLELCRQIRKLGKQIIYFPNCQIIHRHGISGKNITDSANQWRRLIPSAKLYSGLFNYYLIYLIIWLGQKIFKR